MPRLSHIRQGLTRFVIAVCREELALDKLTREHMTETVIKHDCQRCGHSPDWHRFDDYRLSEFEGVPLEERPFRCLGPSLHGCDQECPDFIGEAVTLTGPRPEETP